MSSGATPGGPRRLIAGGGGGVGRAVESPPDSRWSRARPPSRREIGVRAAPIHRGNRSRPMGSVASGAMSEGISYPVGSRTVKITHPERVLFPDDGADQARPGRVPPRGGRGHAPPPGRPAADAAAVPRGHRAGRLLPEGGGAGRPRWIRTVEVAKEGGTVRHPVIDDEAGLLALTNLSTVSFHRWPSRADRAGATRSADRRPRPVVRRLRRGRAGGQWVRAVFDELDLAAYVEVSGSRASTWWRRSTARPPPTRWRPSPWAWPTCWRPGTPTTSRSRAARRTQGRLYVDVARNGWAQTVVAPYSVRPRPGAPVAMPIEWDELDDPGPAPRRLDDRHRPRPGRRRGRPVGGIARHARALGSREEARRPAGRGGGGHRAFPSCCRAAGGGAAIRPPTCDADEPCGRLDIHVATPWPVATATRLTLGRRGLARLDRGLHRPCCRAEPARRQGRRLRTTGRAGPRRRRLLGRHAAAGGTWPRGRRARTSATAASASGDARSARRAAPCTRRSAPSPAAPRTPAGRRAQGAGEIGEGGCGIVEEHHAEVADDHVGDRFPRRHQRRRRRT